MHNSNIGDYDMDQLTRQLKISELFYNIEDSEISALLSELNPVISSYEKNEYVAFAGDALDSQFGIILTGSVEILIESAAGINTIVNIASEGELLGEVPAFAGKMKWQNSVLALENTTIAFFKVSSIVKCNHELIANIMKIMATRTLYLSKKVQYLSAKSLKEKIALYLLEQYNANYKTATFKLPLSRMQLADFLNVTRPSLSREMAALKEDGIIDFHRSIVKIKNLKALSNILK